MLLAAGGGHRHPAEPLDGVVDPQRQGHEDHSAFVGAGRCGAAEQERDGLVGERVEIVDVLAPAQQERPQASGDGRQQHVVHRRTVRVRDVAEQVEAAADDAQPAPRPDDAIQARRRHPPDGVELAHRRPRPMHPAHQSDRVGERGDRPPRGPQPAELITQQRGRRRRRRGRSIGRRGFPGHVPVEQGAEQRHPADAVGDDVVHLQEHPDPTAREPGQEPHLPRGTREVEPPAPQLLHHLDELYRAGRRRQVDDVHVPGEVDGGRVHPHRWAQQAGRHLEHLAEPGHAVQPPAHRLPRGIDAEPAVRVERAPPSTRAPPSSTATTPMCIGQPASSDCSIRRSGPLRRSNPAMHPGSSPGSGRLAVPDAPRRAPERPSRPALPAAAGAGVGRSLPSRRGVATRFWGRHPRTPPAIGRTLPRHARPEM